MRINGLEKMSLVDYDGKVSATIFTGGCNFICPFCHNSPLVTDFKAQPILLEEEVLSYLKKRKGLLDGVCISGGEPTLQSDLIPFIEKVKNLGYCVKLDTNGTNPAIIKQVHTNGLVDYFAMDIKNDKANYAKTIGLDNFDTSKIERSVEYLMTSGADYEFRTTLIHEYHSLDNIRLIGEWIKGAKKYFLQQFKDTGSCIKGGLSAVSAADAITFKNAIKIDVPNTFLRGYDV